MADGTPERHAAPRAEIPATPLFGIPLAEVAYEDVIESVQATLSGRGREPLIIDAANTMGMAEGCRNARMREALLSYDLIVPDGMPLVWCMNAKGAKLT